MAKAMPILVGKVTHVFRQRRCVAVKLAYGGIEIGEILSFVKGDADKPDLAHHESQHLITSLEIDHRQVEAAILGDHCAVRIDSGPLPPNNADVRVLVFPTL